MVKAERNPRQALHRMREDVPRSSRAAECSLADSGGLRVPTRKNKGKTAAKVLLLEHRLRERYERWGFHSLRGLLRVYANELVD